MNPHDNEEEKSIASEPQMAYGNISQAIPLQYNSPQNIPDDYMSLEQFGELFHQKLDDCYAHLPSNN